MTKRSLRTSLGAIKAPAGVRVPSGFSGPRPAGLRELIRACKRPRMSEWGNPERAFAENKDWTEELNGLVTDGHAWYASCNAEDDREGLYKLTMGFGFVRKLEHGFDVDERHIGALAVRNGKLFVPVQTDTRGVWIVDTDLTAGQYFPADKLEDDDLFAWCDVHPRNGLIYTCNFSHPKRLFAYDISGSKLVRVKKADIPLRQPKDGKPTTEVQGGCFTPNFKWLAVCDVDEAERIHCHSTLTGALLDRRTLLAEADESSVGLRNELEGIWYHPMHTGAGSHVHVHVLELNNEHHTADDMYLWQFSLPASDVL